MPQGICLLLLKQLSPITSDLRSHSDHEVVKRASAEAKEGQSSTHKYVLETWEEKEMK